MTLFSIGKHTHTSSAASFEYSHVSKSLIYVIMRELKASIYKLSSRAPKTKKIEGHQHRRKASRLLHGTKQAFTLAPAITYLRSIAIVSVSGKSII